MLMAQCVLSIDVVMWSRLRSGGRNLSIRRLGTGGGKPVATYPRERPLGYVHDRGNQLKQFREPHIGRRQSARAMKVPDMSYSIWTICDNN
jgi:hypothetical protein